MRQMQVMSRRAAFESTEEGRSSMNRHLWAASLDRDSDAQHTSSASQNSATIKLDQTVWWPFIFSHSSSDFSEIISLEVKLSHWQHKWKLCHTLYIKIWALNIGCVFVWLCAHSWCDSRITPLFQTLLLHKRTLCQLSKHQPLKVGQQKTQKRYVWFYQSIKCVKFFSSSGPDTGMGPKKWCQLEQSGSGLVLLDQFRLNTSPFLLSTSTHEIFQKNFKSGEFLTTIH